MEKTDTTNITQALQLVKQARKHQLEILSQDREASLAVRAAAERALKQLRKELKDNARK